MSKLERCRYGVGANDIFRQRCLGPFSSASSSSPDSDEGRSSVAYSGIRGQRPLIVGIGARQVDVSPNCMVSTRPAASLLLQQPPARVFPQSSIKEEAAGPPISLVDIRRSCETFGTALLGPRPGDSVPRASNDPLPARLQCK